jgi:quinol monooxygenase YgiN
MASTVRVLSERLMQPGKETAVRKVMEKVVLRVRKQPGFISGDVLADTSNPSVYAILTEWDSKKHLQRWLDDPDYASLTKELNGLLGAPVKYQILQRQKDEIFLL